MAAFDLRKLKDQAAKALEKKNYAKAAGLFLEISQYEPTQPDWQQRAGEALRKAGNIARAVEHLANAAEGYARGGFLLKGVAVCKVVLSIDPRHTVTQALLADLYATRDHGTRTASGSYALHSSAVAARFAPPRSAPGERSSPPTPVPMPPAFEEPPSAASPDVVISLDDRPRGPTIPPGRPMEVIPLHEVLGGRPSQQFRPHATPADGVETTGERDTGSAYEISIDEQFDELGELASEAAAAMERTAASMAPPAPTPADELDFSHVLNDAERVPRSEATGLDRRPTEPVLPSVMPTPPLPQIPLFSSLDVDQLRHLIEQVEMREVEAGETIVREGELGGSLFVIVHGEVTVMLKGPPKKVMARLGEGSFFGELAVLTDFPRSATVVAEVPTQLLEISRQLIAEIVADSPDVLRVMLRFFRDRLLDRLLGTSKLFASFNVEEARSLAGRFKFLELDPGMRVVREGERAQGLFLLLCGQAHVVRGNRQLAALAPGDVFGEMSLLTRAPATASIETDTKCWALALPREDFQEIVLTYPQVLEYISELAARRSAGPASESDEHVEFI